MLRVHVRAAKLCISDVRASLQPEVPGGGTLGLKRLDHLWQSLTDVKSCWDILLSIPPSSWAGLSLVSCGHVTQCIKTLFTLSTLDEPGWDGEAARGTCDILAMIDATVDILSRASAHVEGAADDDVYGVIGRNMMKGRENMAGRLSTNKTAASNDATELPGSRILYPGPIPGYGFFGTGEWMEQMFEGTF